MVFFIEEEKDLAYMLSVGYNEYRCRSVQDYKKGLHLGLPPAYEPEVRKEIASVQPYDLLSVDGAQALDNIIYNQEQLDLVNYHAVTIRNALMPVVTAFASSPNDMGSVMNFCT